MKGHICETETTVTGIGVPTHNEVLSVTNEKQTKVALS